MPHVFAYTESFIKPQRSGFVVFNSFTPYSSVNDLSRFARRKQFFANSEVAAIQRSGGYVHGTPPVPPPPPTESGDVFCGNDTYGWPEPDPPWWSKQPGYYLNFTTSFLYNPITDVPRFKKRVPVFGEYQEFPKRSNQLNLGFTEFLTQVVVPDLIGNTTTEATTELGVVGLNLLVAGSQYDDINPVGTVSAQFPVAGQFTFLGASVSVLLSLGPVPVVYPGITLPDAIYIAINSGLVVGQPIRWQYDPSVPYNYVISQDPPAGTTLPLQTTVYFVASLGPAPTTNTYVVPDVTNLMVLDAQRLITDAGGTLGQIIWVYSDTIPGQYVVTQSVPGGTVIPYGTVIRLTVSAGTPVTTLPGAQIVIPTMH